MAVTALAFLILLLLPCTQLTTNTAATTLPLIHVDSVDSPFHKSGETSSQRIERVVERSNARILELAGSNDAQTPIVPNTRTLAFMVNFSIGDPPVLQLAFMDTGSPMLWLKCREIQEPPYPIFNPYNSDTFSALPCRHPLCPGGCQPGVRISNCPYTMNYLSRPKIRSVGMYAFEELTFYTKDGGINKMEDIVFGCSEMEENFDDDFRRNGIFGLSRRDGVIDLVGQMESRFSYCLGNVLDSSTYPSNFLALRDGAILQGPPTPLALVDGIYYLTLEGIDVNGDMLDIDPNFFKRQPGGIVSGVAIDSGSELTYLTRAAYFTLKYTLLPLLDFLTPLKETASPNLICYKGDIANATDDLLFPWVTFHFSGGVKLTLKQHNLFYSVGKVYKKFCLSIYPTLPRVDLNLSIIGIQTQQGYNVGYDLKDQKLYLDSTIDCKSYA
ncbi:hypothetical protein Tsubulata_046010 [Turnera subulata]|uniref:Peptidase A1 domain-containing protein n=1 Tax=Turnera subulata TaxID=218843 RepID=A0A9Q0FHK0_9ROSI|nr:hypothetical protein Tsubulata_046010 [Turnera subulata]